MQSDDDFAYKGLGEVSFTPPSFFYNNTEQKMPDLDNAILKAYASGAIGNGTNDDRKRMIVTTDQVVAQPSPLSASQKPPKRPAIKIKVVCAYAVETGCLRKFADKACCKAVASSDCSPPGSVRQQFAAGGNVSRIQADIAGGAFVRNGHK